MSRRALLTVAMVGWVGLGASRGDAAKPWVVYDGFDGPGDGKHVVLVSGDEEYRSEESLPQLGKLLAKHHGFKCTVLFPIDPKTGKIDPNTLDNIPGLQHLSSADLMVIFTRFRKLPDGQMKHIDAYLHDGRPVLGMRTATHAFKFPADSKWAHYSNGYNGPKKAWQGGFGRLVLGEKWITHHGNHGQEATRGIIPNGVEDHPMTNGIDDGDIFGLTDVYGVRLPLPGDSRVLVRGQVVNGMSPDDPPVEGKKNDPMMPVSWTKSYQLPGGSEGRAFTTTMGASVDLKWEGTRRMLVNAVYDLLEMEVPKKATVSLVGDYQPSMYGFGDFKKGLKPSHYAMSAPKN